MMFTEAAARGVKAFVDNGGYVAAEARFAWNDDRGYASDRIPGMGLSNVFGVQENEVWMREEEILFELTGHSHPATASLQSGSHLIGTLYGNSMTPLKGHDVQVLANLSMTGDPAITVHRYGEGEAMMIGTFLGMANHPDLVNENVQFILGLADWAGIERTAQSSHDGRSEAPVAVRLQKNEDGWLLFAINHGMDKEQVEITLRTNEGQSYSLHELTRDTRSQAEASEGNLSVRVDMDGRDARVWSIKKQYQP
jgi:beta-galactosidase